MATSLDIKYDPAAIANGLRKAANEFVAASKAANDFGASAVRASGEVYKLAQDTYKLAGASDEAAKEVFSLKKTIDQMVATAPTGIKRMREEMAKFKEEAKATDKGVGSGGAAKKSTYGAGGQGAGGGEFLASAIGQATGLSQFGLGGEALKSVLPSLLQYAGTIAKVGTGVGAMAAIVQSSISIQGNWNKTLHESAQESDILGPKLLSLGESLGTFTGILKGTREGLAAANAEVERSKRLRVTGTRGFDADEKQSMAFDSVNSPAGRQRAAWLKNQQDIEIAEGRAKRDTANRISREQLAADRIKQKEQWLADWRKQNEINRLTQAQRTSDKLVQIAQAEADRISKAQAARERASGIASDTGPLGGLARAAIDQADPKAVARSTRMRRNMLLGDSKAYNKYLRDEEVSSAESRINAKAEGERGKYGYDQEGLAKADAERRREIARARGAASRNMGQRNRSDQREIAKDMQGPGETARATGEVASESVALAAKQAGLNQSLVQGLQGAVTELTNKQMEIDRLQADVDRAMAMLQGKSRAKAQRTGRN